MTETLDNLRQRITAWRTGHTGNDAIAFANQLIDDMAKRIDSLSGEGRSFEGSPLARQVRQVLRDLVIIAAGVSNTGAPISEPIDRLEDLAVEALVAAGEQGDSDFEAAAAFDLFWPEGLPPPSPPAFDLVAAISGHDAADNIHLKQRIAKYVDWYDFPTATALHQYGVALVRDLAMALGFDRERHFACAPRPGEPVFPLMARDASFDGLIEIWCEARRMLISMGLKPKGDMAKVIEAHAIAEAGRQYRLNAETAARMQRAGLAPAAEDDDTGGSD